ncbi:unnamed protein product [Prunus brigantina]
MLFLGGQLRKEWTVFSRGRCGPSAGFGPGEDKIGKAVVKLQTPVWCRPKALRCLSQL